ncbi:transcriptional regulator [Histoplasma ohiense]|nr:transcriptional regulator [Histoplasma ohiense (nom. inval.)]
MSDSDSDSDSVSSTRIPSDEILEKGLRDTVAAIFKRGNLDELTVKRVRSGTEKALGLEEGFYKNDEVWKARSDQIIKREAAKQDELATEQEEKPTPVGPKRAPLKPQAPKRASISVSQPARKRRRTATPPESEEDLSSPPSEGSEEEEEKTTKSQKRAHPANKASKPVKQTPKPKPAPSKADTSSELSDVIDVSENLSERTSLKGATQKDEPSETKHDESESEMSVVIDDEPPPKTKRRKSSEPLKQGKTKNPSKPSTASSSKAKDAVDANPDLEEIKKLQGQLVKCGIRKMWFRELAPYDTPREKVKHLRHMLKDAGMKGRFSLEKAKAIRESRELQADLEVVREGAKRWGTNVSDEDEAGDGGRPRRRVARGFQSLSFLGDEDGEEID